MSKAISRTYLAIIAILVIVGAAGYAYYAMQPVAPQQAAPVPKPAPAPQPQYPAPAPKPAPAPVVPDKFKADGYSPRVEATFLIADAGKDRGIWAKYGLDPDFVYNPGGRSSSVADIKAGVAAGTQIGLSGGNALILARSQGVQVKLIAGYLGENHNIKIYVRADSTIKTLKDLDGKKVGVVNTIASYKALIDYYSLRGCMESLPCNRTSLS